MDDPKVKEALERLRVDERIPAAGRERLLDRAAQARSKVATMTQQAADMGTGSSLETPY